MATICLLTLIGDYLDSMRSLAFRLAKSAQTCADFCSALAGGTLLIPHLSQC